MRWVPRGPFHASLAALLLLLVGCSGTSKDRARENDGQSGSAGAGASGGAGASAGGGASGGAGASAGGGQAGSAGAVAGTAGSPPLAGGSNGGDGGTDGAGDGLGGAGGEGAPGGAGGEPAAGGIGGAGGAEAEIVTKCSSLYGYNHPPTPTAVRETYEGSNGTFTDRCLSETELEQYVCAFQTICGAGMMDCAPFPTGQVISGVYECMTPCVDGACD